MVAATKMLFLDEFSQGVDIQQRRFLWDKILTRNAHLKLQQKKNLQNGIVSLDVDTSTGKLLDKKTIVLTSHSMEE